MTPRVSEVLADLRRRLRRGIVVRGLCWTLAVVLGGLAVAGGVDVWLHVDHGWLRLVLVGMVLGGAALTAYLQLWRPLAGRWDDETLALLVERMRPEYRDRLANAVAVWTSDDASGRGAASLRRQAVALAEASLDWQLARQLPQRWLAAAGGGALLAVFVALGGWLLAAPETLGLALERQWQPFDGPDWPRMTVLMLLDEHLEPLAGDHRRWPAEEPLTIYVANRKGNLPDDLQLEVQTDAQPIEAVAWTETTLRDARGREQTLAVATLTPHPGRLSLRPRGGDDDTQSWQSFDVRPAPRLEQFEIEIIPPPYTGLPTILEQRTSAHVEGLIGSSVTLRARANVPLASVQLERDGMPPQPLILESDQRGCTVELKLTDEGRSSFWFELRDEYGVSSTRPIKYELRGRRDQPPQVTLEHPVPETNVTAVAQLPLVAQCSDDIGLSEVQLVVTNLVRGGAIPPVSLVPADQVVSPEAAHKSIFISFDWSLDTLTLQPGMQVEYQVEAVDNREPDPQRTRSQSQSLRIVTAEEKRREIAGLQAGMAQLVGRIGEQLERATQQCRELDTQWRIAGQLRELDRQTLDELEQQPRRSLADLTDARVGLAMQIERVRNELRWNRLDDAATTARMQRLTAHLQPLVMDQLPRLRQHAALLHGLMSPLVAARNDAADAAEPFAVAAAFTHVADDQGAVERTLAAMQFELQDWRQRLDSQQVLDELLTLQQQLHSETKGLSAQTLSRLPEDLSPQQQADLASLADRQREMGKTVQRMLTNAGSTDDRSAAAENAESFPPEVSDGRLLAWMRQAADFVAANQLSQAGEQQAQILKTLAAALDQQTVVNNGDPQQLLELLDRLRTAVDELQQRQTDLQRQTESLRPASADPSDLEQLETLQKQHVSMTEALEGLASQLQRQLLTAAAREAGQAASHSRGAQQALARSQREEVAELQQRVSDDLSRLAEELRKEQQQAESRQQANWLMPLMDGLPPLRASALSLADETEAVEAERAAAGRWGRGLLKRLQNLTAQQEQTVRELRELESRSGALDLVQAQLRAAADELSQATNQLQLRDTGRTTSAHQHAAAERLELLITSLQPPKAGGPGTSGPTASDSAATAELNFVELRLLRTLQADLLRRTEEWHQQLDAGKPTSEEASVLSGLADEQADLGERAARLWQKLQSPATGKE
ncbi:MAG: hypothetical protein ACK5Q5_16525 [Planctomycetaceae bacterium]